MKILFTGGGSGGHFYPIIAVAEEINRIIKDEKLLPAELYFMSDAPYDPLLLAENNIRFIENPAGKIRRYFSLKNFTDLFKTGWGVLQAIIKVFSLYPDVIFSKGAYPSFPALVAAKIFRIPVVIHESDSAPGKTNLWAGKFAARVALSYGEAADFFPPERTAVTGNPVRRDAQEISTSGAYEHFNLEPNIPVVLVIGGSYGAKLINECVLEALPSLVETVQIIHQTGKSNYEEVRSTADVVLGENPLKTRYKPIDYLNSINLKMAAGAARIVVTRAGSALFEIALWGKPAIVIPITETNADHQRKNAYSYARAGAGIVIEENNLSATILASEIKRIVEDPTLIAAFAEGARSFARPKAGETVAREILKIALSHEK
jgi:UDP-N-acetylglucosamine--N-acetylmuramyl-(pentapeptide) pyrophosphoryl-undecaprenol N-acetylglucosamine transferase